MSRKTRGSLINPNEVTIVHTTAKTARNLFLLGVDFATNTHNSHRKDWIIDILEFQSSLMAIDLLGFCLMNNHIHQILRSRPDVVKQLDNHEIARRWMTLCPKSKKRLKVGDKVQYVPIAPKETQIEALAKNDRRIGKIREQLSSISWWMRLLCQKVAQRANAEDGGSMGPFWKGRFHATVIDDDLHLLGSSLYVDLNAFKAAITQSIDGYQYTSAKFRLDMIQAKQNKKQDEDSPNADDVKTIDSPLQENHVQATSVPKMSRGEFLSQVRIETLSHDPQVHKLGYRCSDKGYLEYSVKEYLDALDWCIRNNITQAEAKLPKDVPDCLKMHKLGAETVIRQAREFGKMYRYRTGKSIESMQQESCFDSELCKPD